MEYDVNNARTWKDATLDETLLHKVPDSDQRMIRSVYDPSHYSPTKGSPHFGRHYHSTGVGSLHRLYFAELQAHDPEGMADVLNETKEWVDREIVKWHGGALERRMEAHRKRLNRLLGTGEDGDIKYEDFVPSYFVKFALGKIPFRDRAKARIERSCDENLLIITPGYKRKSVLSVHPRFLIPPESATQADSEDSALFIDWMEV